jgi:hypothetical protein
MASFVPQKAGVRLSKRVIWCANLDSTDLDSANLDSFILNDIDRATMTVRDNNGLPILTAANKFFDVTT